MTCGVTCGVRFWILRENRIEMCSRGLKEARGDKKRDERRETREERRGRREERGERKDERGGRRQEERGDKRSVHLERMSKAYRFS